PTQGLGAGQATWSAGLRLRYELARQFAPYVGVAWCGAAGETARLRRSRGEETQETRLLLGVRA
ncbi:MAG TPA: copper resistance protein B, partial [Phenylobacterium sp.]|nr:copper resistance protein B [Phenylobacterium sp.]